MCGRSRNVMEMEVIGTSGERNKVPDLRPRSSKVKKFNKAKKLPEDLEADLDEQFRKNEKFQKNHRKYALAALERFNRRKEIKYSLVKPGRVAFGGCGFGVIYHANFKAKPECSDGPVETMFAQMRRTCISPESSRISTKIIVDLCISLGPSHEQPDKPYMGGCIYCPKTIHHPYGGAKRLLTGNQQDDYTWLPYNWQRRPDLSDPPSSDDDQG